MDKYRQKLIQLVHIGKQQLALDEETYRHLLIQQFGQPSSKLLCDAQLQTLIVLLQQKGAKIILQQGKPALTALQRKLWAVWKSTADNATSDTLNAYIARMGIDMAWNKLNNPQTIQVLETLKQWQKRVGK